MVFQSPLFDKETPYAPEPENALLERGFRGESWKPQEQTQVQPDTITTPSGDGVSKSLL
jgi:hypothetical protein